MYRSLRRLGDRGRSFMLITVQRVVSTVAVALWFGGFSCYATFVVKAGERVVGSLPQGYVTQQTTDVFNVLAVIMIAGVALSTLR